MKNYQKFPLRFSRKPIILENKPERKRPLTVCIACICEHGLIIGASDRMLTSGDIEFEPVPSSNGTSIINKFTPVSESVVVMMAGESGLQVEILTKVINAINAQSKPKYQPTVKAVVDAYIHFYDEIKRQRAESSVLAPLGLDANTFIVTQKEFSDGFSETIARALIDFQMPGVETIITGVDNGVSHLYKLIGNQMECCDLIGFAAIGSGARHAESQFMSRGYCLAVPQEEALWLIYMAKRKSEVAPGVGKETDLFAISPKNGIVKKLTPAVQQMEIHKVYGDFEIKQNSAFQDAVNEIKPRLIDFFEKSKSAPTEPPPSG